MPRPGPDAEKLVQIAALCREAVQGQRDRERGQGYGIDDYTEGRIVGSANLARKILRVVTGSGLEPAGRLGRARGELVG